MKRLLCLLLCLAMVLSMAACGKATPAPSEKEPTSSQPADPAPEAQPAPETEPENPDNAYIDEMAAKPAPSGAVGYIDISINPLVRLYFDVNDVIIEVRYLNGDAKDAFEEKVEEHKVEGVDLEKGIRILTETAIEKGYLKEGAPVTVGIEIIEEEAAVKADLEKLAEATVLAVVESEEVTAVVTVAESAEEVVQQHKENNKKNDGNNGNHNGQITPDDAPNSSQQGNGQTPGVGEQTNTGAPGNSGGNNNAGGNSGNNGNNGNNRPSVDDDEDEDDDDGGNSWFPGIGDDDADEDDTPSGGSGSEEETAPVITLFRKGKELAAGHTFNTIDSMQMEVHADGKKVTDFTVSVAAPAQLAASPEDGYLVVTPLKVGKTTFTVSYEGGKATYNVEVPDFEILMRHCTGGMTVSASGTKPGVEDNISIYYPDKGHEEDLAIIVSNEEYHEERSDFTFWAEDPDILELTYNDGKIHMVCLEEGDTAIWVRYLDKQFWFRIVVEPAQEPAPFELTVQYPDAEEESVHPGASFGLRRFQNSAPASAVRIYKDGQLVPDAAVTMKDPDQTVVTVEKQADGSFAFTPVTLGVTEFTVTVGEDSLDYTWDGGVDWIRLYNNDAPFHLVGMAGNTENCEWTRVAPGASYHSYIAYDNGLGEFDPDSVSLVKNESGWDAEVVKSGSQYYLDVTVPADATGVHTFVLRASYGGNEHDFGVAFLVDGTATPPVTPEPADSFQLIFKPDAEAAEESTIPSDGGFGIRYYKDNPASIVRVEKDGQLVTDAVISFDDPDQTAVEVNKQTDGTFTFRSTGFGKAPFTVTVGEDTLSYHWYSGTEMLRFYNAKTGFHLAAAEVNGGGTILLPAPAEMKCELKYDDGEGEYDPANVTIFQTEGDGDWTAKIVEENGTYYLVAAVPDDGTGENTFLLRVTYGDKTQTFGVTFNVYAEEDPLPGVINTHGDLFSNDQGWGDVTEQEEWEVVYNGQVVTDFQVEGEDDSIATFAIVDGKIVATPVANGRVHFTVTYNGKTSRIFIEVLLDGETPGVVGLSIARHDGEMGDGSEFATLEQTEDLTVYYGGEPCTDFTCESENDAILKAENVNGKLRLTPVADGWVGFSVTSADETLYIRLAVGTGGTEIGPAATEVGILWNGESEGNGFYINRLLQEVSTDVLVNGSPVTGFTCESENEDILTVTNDNGKLKLTPTGVRFGTVGFTVSYNSETCRIAVFVGDPNGFYGNDTAIGIRRGDGTMGDGCQFGTVTEVEFLDVVNNGQVITDFTVNGYDDSIAIFEVVNGQLKWTPVSDGEVIFEITDSTTGETAIFKGSFHVEQ